MLNLIDGEAPNSTLDLPNGGVFRRAYDTAFLIQKVDRIAMSSFEYEVAVPGHTLFPLLDAEMIATVVEQPMNCTVADKFPDGKFQAVFDLDLLQLPLTLRQRRDGDRFHPVWDAGHQKS